MKVLIFLHGTLIMHASGIGVSRIERVQQVMDGEASVADYEHYVPVGEGVSKLHVWQSQGAELMYLSSHTEGIYVEKDKAVLARYRFPAAPVLYRRGGESYQDVAIKVAPDVIVEDDCESIGGSCEMVHPNLPETWKCKILSVVVKEFEGIEHLPDALSALS